MTRACVGVQAKTCESPGACEVGPGTCGADGTCTYAVRTQFPAPHGMLIGAAQVAS
jgi:hypothetical protein